MPEDFTVTKVKFAGEKPNPHGGSLFKFYCSLYPTAGESDGNETHDVYWQRKSRELEEGETFYGHIEQGEYGPRFKTDQRPDGVGNFQRPAYKVEGEPVRADHRQDPQAERSRRIERQHSQEMALRWAEIVAGIVPPPAVVNLEVIKDWTDHFAQDLDADVGSSQVAHGASDKRPSVDGDAADLSAESSQSQVESEAGGAGGPVSNSHLNLGAPLAEEASRAQKGKLTQMFHAAGLSRDAMKAVVMWRCGQEKATRQGASQLITDLQEGATHDALLAEIWDAKRAGNPLGARAAALIPSEMPWVDDGSLPEAPTTDDAGVPF